jgi:hypothetical protein
MKEIILPSGAVLKITLASFAESRALYQAFLEEIKVVEIKSDVQLANIFKDFACICMSSKKIEKCLEVCFKRCLYNDFKIDDKTFEPIESREDYVSICVEVARENIMPFMKNLYAQFQQFLQLVPSSQA